MRGDVSVQPARIDQVAQTADHDWVILDADAGGVVSDLKKMDAGLEVRFSRSQECWVVFHRNHHGCPHNGTGGEGSTYLVDTAQASRSATGVWTGLDERIVKRFEEIDPFGRGHYDYGAELERRTLKARDERRKQTEERMAQAGEQVAFALRKDLGERYKGRIFRP